MGNDSGVKARHKQRTVQHHKHAVYPGMTLPTSGVKIDGTTIKHIPREQKPRVITFSARSSIG